MHTSSSRFFGVPHTSLGWLSVALGMLFAVLFYAVANDLIIFSGRWTMALGVLAGILTLLALIGKGERSWLVWLMLIPGMFAILFALGEVLSPH